MIPQLPLPAMPVAPPSAAPTNDEPQTRATFVEFAGNTFFGQLMSAMRKTVEKPAYFHGGHAESVFQSQLDQKLVESISEKTADSIAGPMYELFMLKRD
ncbi:MAG: hypothetical protein FJ295_18965 [Planctomycetes bacterium]|nr:hypothetical protein [Planctomycetota bacterium]